MVCLCVGVSEPRDTNGHKAASLFVLSFGGANLMWKKTSAEIWLLFLNVKRVNPGQLRLKDDVELGHRSGFLECKLAKGGTGRCSLGVGSLGRG